LLGWTNNPNIIKTFDELPAFLQHGNKLSNILLRKFKNEWRECDTYELRYSHTKCLFLQEDDLQTLFSKALQIIEEQYPEGRYKSFKLS